MLTTESALKVASQLLLTKKAKHTLICNRVNVAFSISTYFIIL